MHILIVEDDQGIAFLISEAIAEPGRNVDLVNSGADAVKAIKSSSPDLVLLDYSLPDMNAQQIIDAVRNADLEMPAFIVSTGQGDELIAVEMMKQGAYDYLVKDAQLIKRIPSVVQRALEAVNNKRTLEHALMAKKQSDERLIEEKRRLANIIKATNAGTWEWNFAFESLIINDKYAQILGYTLDEITLATPEMWQSFSHPDDHQKTLQLVEDHLMARTDYFESEVRFRHKEGQWVWVLHRGCITETDTEGKPLVMAGTMQDISDKKQHELLQKEVEVAHQTLEFKQNFLASMSHEMRTPLTGVLGVTELLGKTSLDPAQEDLVTTLQAASSSLKDIIDQVLDYSKIEAGKLAINYYPVAPVEIISHAHGIFDSICRKPIQFKSFLDPALPAKISMDQKRVFQVVDNLIINAVKYSNEGTLTLNVRMEKEVSNDTFLVKLEIIDTGIGIREEKRKLMFTPFSQVHQIDTSFYEGTGLGLAICKEIVELHGGKIDIISEAGNGTTVWFTILAKKVEIGFVESEKESINIEPSRQLNILLAEDKTITQKVVGLQLRELGHRVVIASNGREAVQLCENDLFDLVLMDIQMPVMDGISAMREIKKQSANQLPVVGLSANAFDGDREKYMKLGFDEYITKPMQIKQFQKVVVQLFR